MFFISESKDETPVMAFLPRGGETPNFNELQKTNHTTTISLRERGHMVDDQKKVLASPPSSSQHQQQQEQPELQQIEQQPELQQIEQQEQLADESGLSEGDSARKEKLFEKSEFKRPEKSTSLLSEMLRTQKEAQVDPAKTKKKKLAQQLQSQPGANKTGLTSNPNPANNVSKPPLLPKNFLLTRRPSTQTLLQQPATTATTGAATMQLQQQQQLQPKAVGIVFDGTESLRQNLISDWEPILKLKFAHVLPASELSFASLCNGW